MEIEKLSEQELRAELQDGVAKRRKLIREIDMIDTYLVGLREEDRRRREKARTNTTCGGNIDDVIP
jgi:hypothetical protein